MSIRQKYRQVLSGKYIFIYLLFFFVFFSVGAADENISVFFAGMERGEVYFGVFLSVCAAGEVILPLLTGLLSARFGPVKVAVSFFVLVCLTASLLLVTDHVWITMLLFIPIVFSRTVFNFSCGSAISLKIRKEDKGKFFAVRDIFLYGSVALAMFLCGLFAESISISRVIAAEALFLIVPVVMLLTGRGQEGLTVSADREQETLSLPERLKVVLRDRDFICFLLIQFFLKIDSCTRVFLPFLALRLQMNYQSILNSFAALTIINALLALFVSGIADERSKKKFFFIDIISEILPLVCFWLSHNMYVFVAALLISALKDVFAPVTFAYKYEIFDRPDGNIYISALESATAFFAVILPVPLGFLWGLLGQNIFLLSMGAILLASLLILRLPDGNA